MRSPVNSTTSFVINGSTETDSLTVNLATSPGARVTWNAGEGDDTLAITGGEFEFTTVSKLDDKGIINLDRYFIAFTKDQPIDLAAVTSSNLTLDLPDTADNATVTTIAEGVLLLSSSDEAPTFESVKFAVPVGNITIDAGDGNDRVVATTTTVPLVLVGGSGNDTLAGGSQNDTLAGGLGDDDLDGGGGTDVLTISQDGHLTITTTQTFGQGTDTFANIEQAVLKGGARNNRLDASLATIPVTLLGQAGNDTLLGGSAADVLNGGAGIDFAEVFGSNIVLTNASAPGASDETLIDLEGLLLVASARNSNIDASGYTLGPVIIVGSGGDDTLTGGPGDDLILAGAGNDSVVGGSGADFIRGGSGDDTLAGNAGDDTISGGRGRDLIDGNTDADILIGGGGPDTIRGGTGDDFLIGGGGRDSIDGDDGADTLFGGGGADDLAGGLGSVSLNGIARDDSFNQVVGRDTLIGGNRPAGRGFVQRPAAEPLFQAPPTDSSSEHDSEERESFGGSTDQDQAELSSEIDAAFADVLLPELLAL